ncbi:hypothetical protein ACFFX0_25475 [Citricoccus parietis]|uniref:Uncharacterized protein n=1 Tax=Citricoccus parietis TaxID=592307 RepID=A0ABV5G5Y3_9MICC
MPESRGPTPEPFGHGCEYATSCPGPVGRRVRSAGRSRDGTGSKP